MLKLVRQERRPDDGAVAILITVVVVAVIMPLMAIVVDLGLTRMFSQQSRGAADAAALAAAADRPNQATMAQATNDARALVEANLAAPVGGWGSAWSSCSDAAALPTLSNLGPCISFDFANKRVRVTIPQRTVPTIFSGALGRQPPAASATTTASWGLDSATTCALCVINGYSGGRKLVRVDGGNVKIGDTLTATSGDLRLTVPGAGAGAVTYVNGSAPPVGTVTPIPVRGVPPVDPFASTFASLKSSVPYGQVSKPGPSASTPGPCDPGAYQDISYCTTFGQGIYYVTGKPTQVPTPVSLNGDTSSGVLLYLTCSTAGSGSTVLVHACSLVSPAPRFNGAGGSSAVLSARGGGSNLALVFDNGIPRTQRLSSGGQLTINGSVYGPDVTIGGNGSSLAVVQNGRLVVGRVSLTGSSVTNPVLQIVAPPPSQGPVPDGPVRLAPSS